MQIVSESVTKPPRQDAVAHPARQFHSWSKRFLLGHGFKRSRRDRGLMPDFTVGQKLGRAIETPENSNVPFQVLANCFEDSRPRLMQCRRFRQDSGHGMLSSQTDAPAFGLGNVLHREM